MPLLSPLLLALTLAAPACSVAAGPFDVRAYGAKGDGATDDSGAFQAALDAARLNGGGVVLVPAGTYLVAPPPDEGGSPRLRSLTIGSNTWLRGEGPASVIKVKPGVGSYRALLSNHPEAASPVENVTISDLRFDQNCGASGGTVWSSRDDRTLFAIYLAWGGRNLTVERVRFDPVCGVSTVVLNAPTAQGLTVRDSYFRFVKGPTTERTGHYDNTAVYLDGQGEVVSGNVFESTAADGARGAIELHGARGVASGNLTRWYRSCVRVVGTGGKQAASPWNGFTVTGNTCAEAQDAINVWSGTAHHVHGVVIAGNTISLAELDHLAAARHLQYFSGISFAWDRVSGMLAGDIADVVIEANVITAQPSQGVWGANAYATGGILLTAEGNLADLTVRGNVVRGVPTKGIHVQAMGSRSRARGIRIEGNVVVDAGNDPSAGAERAGIVVAGKLEDVEVAHNSILDTGVPFKGRYALRVEADPGSARVSIHDNAWSSADPNKGFELALDGPIDAGTARRTAALSVAPRSAASVTLDPSRAGLWDLTVTRPEGLAVRVAPSAMPGQRLTIRLRNGLSGPLGEVRWEGFKMAPWTNPAPGSHRVLEVEWDGESWRELFHSPLDIPN
ncbi:MAG TPA: glycosyl hydrolase family 28-related protein [Myxococcales bacterium]|jgi:hypothetical protein